MSRAWLGPNMRAALEESKPGCCVFCDAPVRERKVRRCDRIPKRRYPLMCHSRDCLRGYNQAYKRDQREARRAGGG